MSTVAQHYASLLAPVYVWMAGGIEAALRAGAEDVAAFVPGTGVAVDLGAGFGMHAIPLARGGYEVTALDTSPLLLDTLREHGAGLGIRAVQSDLMDFRRHLDGKARLILCMGDTLTHLGDISQVKRLAREVVAALAPGGHFVVTFRDYSSPPDGTARFIPVRNDADRILTCFLEAFPDHMVVHDVLHERQHSSWQMKVSSYRKLRLAPAAVEQALSEPGLVVRVEPGARGMIRMIAGA